MKVRGFQIIKSEERRELVREDVEHTGLEHGLNEGREC